jgi:hypothetical protein
MASGMNKYTYSKIFFGWKMGRCLFNFCTQWFQSLGYFSMRVIFIFLHRPITKAWTRKVFIFELEIFQALRSVCVKCTSIFCKISLNLFLIGTCYCICWIQFKVSLYILIWAICPLIFLECPQHNGNCNQFQSVRGVHYLPACINLKKTLLINNHYSSGAFRVQRRILTHII